MDSRRPPIEGGIHRYWWTTLMALPVGPGTPAYSALWRVWADNTINTVFEGERGELRSKAKRGVFLEDSEDHLMVALFENWAAFPDCSWVGAFLNACGVCPQGEVQGVGWSYEYTQDRPRQKPGKLTADIVIHWRDAAGSAVLVLETKKPGNRQWGAKDLPSTSPYLDVPGFDGIGRRYICMLIGADDARAMAHVLDGEAVLTWEALCSLQAEAFTRLSLPESVKIFMVGALLRQYAHYGILPDPLPIGWLEREPSAPMISTCKQSRTDRRVGYWRSFRQEAKV